MDIRRRNPPTKLDTAPIGTICHVQNGDDKEYIQMSSDEEKPRWRPIVVKYRDASQPLE